MPALFEDDKTEFNKLINDLKSSGRGGLIANVRFCPEYVDRENTFEKLGEMVDVLYDEGLGFWLYDELGYPSGSAGGRTVLNDPELMVKGIVFEKLNGEGKNPVLFDRDPDVTKIKYAYAITENGTLPATVTDDKVIFDGADGQWTLWIFSEQNFYEGTHAKTSGYAGKDWVQPYYPNIMDKKAVRKFIDVTYKPYAERFKHFNKLPGVFTDEPSLMEPYQHTGSTVFKYARASWTDGFEDEFFADHGYRIEENLHHIFEGDSDYSKTVRVNYRQTVARLVSENYFGQINEFCEKHGTKLSGHCLLEEVIYHQVYYYGDIMACLRKMGVPGVDSLNGMTKMFMNPGWPSFLAVKYATSTNTLQRDERLSMVELCAVDFTSFPITDEQRDNLFTTANFMLFGGITQINAYFPLEQCRDKMNFFTDYLSRLTYVSRSLKWAGEVGLYYPINTYQAYSKPDNFAHRNVPDHKVNLSETALEIYKNSLDFTVVDNIFLKEAHIENGTLTNGFASFKAIVLPDCEVVPYDVMEKLTAFKAQGGTVIFLNMVPTLGDVYDKSAEFTMMAKSFAPVDMAEAMCMLVKSCKYPLGLSGGDENVWLGKYLLDGAETYWILNNNAEDKVITLSYENTCSFDVYDPTNGTVTEVANNTSVTIPSRSAVIVTVK